MLLGGGEAGEATESAGWVVHVGAYVTRINDRSRHTSAMMTGIIHPRCVQWPLHIVQKSSCLLDTEMIEYKLDKD